jgi:hypothetical protein
MKAGLFPVLLLSLALPLMGQGPGKGKSGASLPLQGKSLPEVTAVDEKGNEVSLGKLLKGKHGVIVFGCLT